MNIKKRLYFYFNRINGYFFTNKLIFILYFCGALMASIVIVYAYGNTFKNQVASQNTYDYKLYQKGYSSYSLDKIIDVASNLHNKYKKIQNIYVTENFSSKDHIDTDIYLNNNFYLKTDLEGQFPFHEYSGRVEFNADEKSGQIHSIILPSSGIDIQKVNNIIGSKIMLLGTEFTVIGLYHTERPEVIVSLNDFFSKTDQIQWMYISFNQILNKNDVDSIYNIFSERITELKMEVPSLHTDGYREYISRLVYIINIYILAMISFLLLFKYLIDCRNYENTILSLCGASKKKIVKIIMMDNIIMSSLPTLVGMVLYIILRPVVFDKISLEGVSYNITDFILIYICILIASILASIPFLINFHYKSLITTKNLYIK